MRMIPFKRRDPITEIHIQVHPPKGWSENVETEELLEEDLVRLKHEVNTLVARFNSTASAFVYRD